VSRAWEAGEEWKMKRNFEQWITFVESLAPNDHWCLTNMRWLNLNIAYYCLSPPHQAFDIEPFKSAVLSASAGL